MDGWGKIGRAIKRHEGPPVRELDQWKTEASDYMHAVKKNMMFKLNIKVFRVTVLLVTFG